MNQLSLQLARAADLTVIMQFINEAKQHLKDQGIDQWQDGYPNQESIAHDIAMQKGYLVVLASDTAPLPIGYLCIDFGGEPAYDVITGGQWHTSEPYAVVHRMTISNAYKGKGLAASVFALVDDFCKTREMYQFRIDTSPENFKMQHVLLKHGFALCGTVVYAGGIRLAYDKILSDE